MKPNNFATPNWEVNAIGDKACNDLKEFQKLANASKNTKKHLKTKKQNLKAKGKTLSEDMGSKLIQKEMINVTYNTSLNNNNDKKKRKLKKGLEAHSNEFGKNSTKKGKKLNTSKQFDKTLNKNKIKFRKGGLEDNKLKNNKNFGIQSTKQNPITDMETIVVENTQQMSKKDGKLVKLKQKIRLTLQKTNTINKNPARELTLRQRMMEKLKSARFRYLNEQIYTTESDNAVKLFKEDPQAFKAYHAGYRQQVNRWPLNPLDTIIKSIQKMPNNYIIADFGCGDARLARSIEQKVHSFDLVATDTTVTACDMSKVPLTNCSVDVVVCCLSLMGTNLKDYLMEANRILKIGGILKIAEVESRFDTVTTFIKGVQQFGFKNMFQDLSHNLFYFLDFKKETNTKNKNKLPTVSLHPCLYKKR